MDSKDSLWQVRTVLVERCLPSGEFAYPRFRQRPARHGPLRAWMTWDTVKGFDLKQHVVAAPPDASTADGLIARLEVLASGSAGISYDAPLWRFEIVEGFRGDASNIFSEPGPTGEVENLLLLIRIIFVLLSSEQIVAKHAQSAPLAVRDGGGVPGRLCLS
ncbi:hypothetical protein T492DRAFT_427898 [Pavlovales sp. CCMP2436]|nr:hypothetical protein T492DRAFT_427898 [Pavlovales sp. CCMP2436]